MCMCAVRVCVCGNSQLTIINQFLNLAAAAAATTDMTKRRKPWTPAFPNLLGNPGTAFQMTSTLPSVSMALVKKNFFILKLMIFRLLYHV